MNRPPNSLSKINSASQLEGSKKEIFEEKPKRATSLIPIPTPAPKPPEDVPRRRSKGRLVPKKINLAAVGRSVSIAVTSMIFKNKPTEEENRRNTFAGHEGSSRQMSDLSNVGEGVKSSSPIMGQGIDGGVDRSDKSDRSNSDIKEGKDTSDALPQKLTSQPQDGAHNHHKGPTWKLSERRLQTRRSRNSIFKGLNKDAVETFKYSQLKNAGESEQGDFEKQVVAAMLGSLKKKHLCDIELVGGDGSVTSAPSYLLVLYSKVLEGILYPVTLPSIREDESEREGLDGSQAREILASRKIDVPFATEPAISAALHFLVTHKLPDITDARIMCQIYSFGKLYRIPSLVEKALRNGRLLINLSNRKMSETLCAAFDEGIALEKVGEESKWWGLSFGGINELKAFALDGILDAPAEHLFRGEGLRFLSPDALQEILSHKELDSDELTIFLILKKWVQVFHGNHEQKVQIAKILVNNIDFSLIAPDILKTQVSSCDFVEKADVDAALREIELRNSSRSPEDFEHVEVEGAGNPKVNGIYVRLDEDIGMDPDDIVFIKEGDDDCDYVDYGLYLHKNKWSIASCVDYSNVFYSCEINPHTPDREEAPTLGWITERGIDPPPLCHWNASKVEGRNRLNGDAPNLEDFHEDIRRRKKHSSLSTVLMDQSDYSDQADDRKRITLWKMLCLPQDESFRSSVRVSMGGNETDEDHPMFDENGERIDIFVQ